MPMPTLYLFRGAPGSGKSTAANALTITGVYWTEADRYMTDDDGKYKFNPTKLPEVHRMCLESASYALANGWDCVVSNTFTRLWEMQPYVDLAKEKGYHLFVVRFSGDYGNTHGVPADKVQQMRDRMEDYPGETFFN